MKVHAKSAEKQNLMIYSFFKYMTYAFSVYFCCQLPNKEKVGDFLHNA